VRSNSLILQPVPVETTEYKLESATLSSPLSASRQYSSKTITKRRSPSKQLHLHAHDSAIDRNLSLSTITSRAKTLSSVEYRTSPQALTSKVKETSSKSSAQFNTSTIRKSPSTHLRGAFVKPDQREQVSPPGRHGSVTKPKAPVLLTQLRAERHKIVEENDASKDDDRPRKANVRQSMLPSTSKLRRLPISTLFSDSASIRPTLTHSTRLQLDSTVSSVHYVSDMETDHSPICHPRCFGAHRVAHITVNSDVERDDSPKLETRMVQSGVGNNEISSGEIPTRDRSNSIISVFSSHTRLPESVNASITDYSETENVVSSGIVDDRCCAAISGRTSDNCSQILRSATPKHIQGFDTATHEQNSHASPLLHYQKSNNVACQVSFSVTDFFLNER
jgi:hypothetical protein